MSLHYRSSPTLRHRNLSDSEGPHWRPSFLERSKFKLALSLCRKSDFKTEYLG